MVSLRQSIVVIHIGEVVQYSFKIHGNYLGGAGVQRTAISMGVDHGLSPSVLKNIVVTTALLTYNVGAERLPDRMGDLATTIFMVKTPKSFILYI